MIGYYKRDFLLLVALCTSSTGFTTVRHASLADSGRLSAPALPTALSYSPPNNPNEGLNSDSSSGQKTRTALTVSSSFNADDLTLSIEPRDRSFISPSNGTAGFQLQDYVQLVDAPSESSKEGLAAIVDSVMGSYIGPRLLLAAVACLYGTNFPLGSIMDQALPASAATSARMLLAASLALRQ